MVFKTLVLVLMPCLAVHGLCDLGADVETKHSCVCGLYDLGAGAYVSPSL